MASAGNSEEETLKRIQQAKYNFLTGNWNVRLNEDFNVLGETVKKNLPGLDYTLVDEVMKKSNRVTFVFRGPGDQKVVVKLKSYESFVNFSVRVGLAGNQSKSAQIFSYIYRKM